MKNIRFLTFVLLLGTLLLSACGAGAATPTSAPGAVTSPKVQAMPVAFVGIIDSMAGDQWVISGTTVTVDASIVRDGPFKVGDQVKVEGHVSSDGSFTVSRVEAPTPQETATQPPFADDNSNDANTNDVSNINDDHGNDANINDDHGVDTNVNDDHGNDANINDDHGADTNINDDHGTDTNINDDKGGAGNSNDDNSNVSSPSNSNTNDDHGGNSSNDNGSGKGSGGGNDNGGNSTDD